MYLFFTHNRTLEDELQAGSTKQRESIETLHTSVWQAQKPNSSELLSGVQKDASAFQNGKRKGEKTVLTKDREKTL